MESKYWLHYPISIDLPFLSVGRLRCGYFSCAGLKGAGFFGIIRSKYERKIIPKTASRLNLPLSNRVRTTFVPVKERATVLSFQQEYFALRGVIYIIRLSGFVFLWHSRQIIASLNLYASWVSMRNASAIIICSEYISMLLPFGRVIYRSDSYFLTIPLLYMALILLLNVGNVTPNNSTSSCVLIHISLALAFGKCTLPCSSIVIIARFILFIIYIALQILFSIFSNFADNSAIS